MRFLTLQTIAAREGHSLQRPPTKAAGGQGDIPEARPARRRINQRLARVVIDQHIEALADMSRASR